MIRKKKIKIIVTLLFLATSSYAEVIFDQDALKHKGIPTEIAKLYSEKAHFPQGESSVSVFLNDKYIGQSFFMFNSQGELCLNTRFIDATDIALSKSNSTCPTIKDYNNLEIELVPSDLRVNIYVSPSLLRNKTNDNWSHTGKSGVLNYDIKYFSSKNDINSQSFLNSNFTLGFNVNNWIVRSDQAYTYFNGETSFDHQTLYAEKTLESLKKNVQIGQINLSNSFFSSGQVIGFQLRPELALDNSSQGGGIVNGIAYERSVIEVRQAGILIYTTTVPEGPYTLKNLPLLNSRLDLSVTVINQSNKKSTFIVPASSFILASNSMNKDITFGFGKVNQHNVNEKPYVMNISKGFNLRPDMQILFGALASKDYQSVGLSNTFEFSNLSLATVTTNISKDIDSKYGEYYTLSYNYPVIASTNLVVNSLYRSKEYKDFNETLNNYDTNLYSNHVKNSNTQYGIGVNTHIDRLGSFSLSWNRSLGDRTINYYNATWHNLFSDKYNVYLGYENRLYNNINDNTIYLNVDISLGNRQSLSGWMNHYGNNKSYGTRYSNHSDDNLSYSVSAIKNTDPRNQSASLNMNYTTPVTLLSGNVSKGNNNSSYYGSLSGGMVYFDNELIFSSKRIANTFAVAKTENQENIPIQSSSGTVMTNSKGYAVIPSIDSYRTNYAKIDYRKLPKNMNAPYGIIEFQPANGSVPLVNFYVNKVNRAILIPSFNGEKLAKNLKVYDKKGILLTITDNAGRIIIDDLSLPTRYFVDVGDNKKCTIDLVEDVSISKTELFTVIHPICYMAN
ncbi:fimbria/pilus outer membrane usher protein [Providencia alcalifaciens]|uniref:fimbria/pilus outer membrane usher protein n=1 Tax=Providencia alcalifaciens TaxID=126385 RepID=UPI001CE083C4|nr:fimbria/pilus outer membrane usher protein [Providencia alcalifaciens]UBX49266.1 fimbria/pilus outer membrane usher protein [Providencia alcalifaciens]